MKSRFFFLIFIVFLFFSLSQLSYSSLSFSLRGSIAQKSLKKLRNHPAIVKVDKTLETMKAFAKKVPRSFKAALNPSSQKYGGCHHIISKQIMARLPSLMKKDQIEEMFLDLGIEEIYPPTRKKLKSIEVKKYSIAYFLIHAPFNLIYPHGLVKNDRGDFVKKYIPSELRSDDPISGFDYVPEINEDGLYQLNNTSFLLFSVLAILNNFFEELKDRLDFNEPNRVFFSDLQFKTLLFIFSKLRSFSPSVAHCVGFSRGKGGLFILDPKAPSIELVSTESATQRRRAYSLECKKKKKPKKKILRSSPFFMV